MLDRVEHQFRKGLRSGGGYNHAQREKQKICWRLLAEKDTIQINRLTQHTLRDPTKYSRESVRRDRISQGYDHGQKDLYNHVRSGMKTRRGQKTKQKGNTTHTKTDKYLKIM